MMLMYFLFQAEDGIRDLVRSRGLGDVYKRQTLDSSQKQRVTDEDANGGMEAAAATTAVATAVELSLIHI